MLYLSTINHWFDAIFNWTRITLNHYTFYSTISLTAGISGYFLDVKNIGF